MDAEDNFFVQIYGEKIFAVYDNRDGQIADDAQVEHSTVKHRNVPFHESFRPRGIEFELDAAPTLVHAHAWALRELSRNLLHNAIKHSPRGAPLVVRLGSRGNEAVLEVDDSGPGLAPGQLEQLFRPFSAAGPQAGAGLGLAICHDIVHSQGGDLSLVNHARRPGLVACARLPLATPGPK